MNIFTRSRCIIKIAPVLLCGLLLASAAVKSQTNLVPDHVEFAALKALYDSTGGSSWTNKDGWPATGSWPASATAAQMNTWQGVTVTKGDITNLILNNKNMTGKLPAAIGNLTSLTILTFSGNRLSGALPAALNQLTDLVTLDLSGNQLSGVIPSLTNLANLVTLNLSNNTISGSIPDLSGLESVRYLYLQNNQLGNSLPASVGQLSHLITLYAYGNQLTGAIPSEINNLTNLTQLALSNNRFTGLLPDLRNLTNLVTLLLANLTSLTPAPIPAWIGSLTNLSSLDLSNSKRNGTIPPGIGNLTGLTSLYLHTNQLSGALPETLGNCRKLVNFYAYNNALSGPIPASLSNWSNITCFYVYNNRLSGTLPELNGWTKVKYFYASNNYLSGSIPSSYGNFTNLIGFNVANNNLSGSVPSTIGNWARLTILGLNNNQLTGDFPAQIGSCKLITSLLAQYNKFTSIPESVLIIPVLTTLNFSFNVLTSIPDFSTYSNKANLNLSIQNNFLGFDKLEPQFNANGTVVTKTLTYIPQNIFNQVTRKDVPAGSTLLLTAAAKGEYGAVTWEKNISGMWASVNASNGDATLQTYQVANVDNRADGTYHWKITNTRITTLTLRSADIAVQVVDGVSSSPEAVAQYGGLISSVRWRTNAAYGSGDADLSGMYVYSYDDKYQIQDARWAEPDHTLNTFTGAGNKYRLTGMTYDLNGNIQTLRRYDKSAVRVNNFTYHYDDADGKNRLGSVTGYTNAYKYNAVGQMTGEDKVSGVDQYVEYNVAGKVVAVYDDWTKTSKKVEYLYDDRGFRLAKVAYRLQGDGSARTTWYIRDGSGNVISICEQEGMPDASNTNPLIQREVPVYGSGKLGTMYPQEDRSTAYEITDHLGNVRALVRENVIEYKATMEDNGRADIINPRVQEMNYFQNLFETEQNDSHMNHTPANVTIVSNPSRSAYLFWQDGVAGMEAADKAVGPAIALKVMPGDTIHAETFVRYENKISYNRTGFTLSLLSALLGNSFASVEGFEGSTIAQTTEKFSMALTGGGFLGDTGDDMRPFAYLNYIVFDESMAQLTSDWIQVTGDGGFDPGEENLENRHERLALKEPLVIPAGGKYIYLWISNESENTKVWFDDLTIRHVTTYVAESTDYGVWGDVLRTSSTEERRESIKENLIAQYTFSGNPNDNSGHNLNGTVSGATLTRDKDNKANAAYAFDGVDDMISVPGTEDDFSFVQNTGVFTVSTFIRLSDLTARSGVLCTSQSTGRRGFTLMYENVSGYDHVIRFFSTIGTSGKLNEVLSMPYAIADNDWHHIAVVGDGQVIRMFIDGNQNNYSVGLTVFGSGDASAPLAIGALRNPNNAALGQLFMHGGIDEVHIFDKALSDAEIRLLARGSSPEEIDKILQPEDPYRYAYQGQFSERDEETGWDHFELREYDPVIGRWTSIDPKRQFHSPYLAMGNNPVATTDPDGGSVVSDWVGNNLPGLMAAPFAGAIDFVEGMGRSMIGLFTLNVGKIGGGLGDAGLGILRSLGLKEFFTEKWVQGTTGGFLPESLKDEMDIVHRRSPPSAWKNGMHAWHAGTNAALAHKLGPVGVLFVFVGGLFHESPMDWRSFKAEQYYQGTINHILDSSTDIIANLFGITMGLSLPQKLALNISLKLGNQIPGPGETDPAFGGGGPYRRWRPWDAWGRYPTF